MEPVRTKKTYFERRQRLSTSLIWNLQRKFYEDRGVEAWSNDGVPYHITSNPFIADAYAGIVMGFLRDRQAELAASGEPLYIVELGAGHGRFGFLFLKRFLRIHRDSVLRDVPVRYVLTDLAEKNLAFWDNHPDLQTFFDDGVLDFARFDVERDTAFRLARSGIQLAAAGEPRPMVFIASYLFDTIRADAFSTSEGVLYEALISTGSLRPLVRDDPALLPHLDIEYANSPAALPYYGDQEWDALLDDCAHRLPSTTFLFPVAALRCIRVLADISGGCMFLLAADKGYHSDQALLDGAGSPFPVLHSDLCFSFMVDFQAISLFVRRRGGTVLQSANQRNLGISGLLLAGNGVEHHETVQAFESAVGKFGPDDLFSLTRHFEKRIEETSFEEIMATLRLSVWDARLLWAAMPVFHRCLEALDDSARSELRDAVHRVWELYYPIGEQADLPFYIGVLLLEVKFYADALRFFHESERLYGPASSTAYNIGACYVHLQQFDSALKAVDRSLELEPAFDAAKTTRIRIESLLAGRHS